MTIRADSFALTPKLYAPVAQYTLRGHGAELFPDRSGNGLNLSTLLTPGYAPDGYPDVCLHAGKLKSTALAPLQIVGDLTCTARVCVRYTGARQFIYSNNDGSGVAGPYVFIVEPDGSLLAGVETANQVSYGYVTTGLRAQYGRWALYSMRRDVAGGRWTVGVNKQYETSPVMTVTVPLDGTQPVLFVGGPDVGTLLSDGGLADLSIWNKRLTDAQVSALVDAVGIDTAITPAAYMPVLYEPMGMWALDFAGTEAEGLADRSGHARHLSKVSLVGTAADLVEDGLAPRGSSGAGTKFTQGVLGGADPLWAITGPMTIACRAWFDGDVSRTQCLYQCNFYPYGPSPVRCVPFTIATVGPSGALLSYTQHGSNQADAYTSALVPPTGRWCWVTFRRAASGVITIGINNRYEDSGAWPVPGPTAAGVQLALMNSNDGIAPLAWGGRMADVGIWNTRLTDAELQPLYRAAMGRRP